MTNEHSELVPDPDNPGSLMFKCICRCCQKHQTLESPGGVEIDIAKITGWTFNTDDGWRCPKCSGREHTLNQVFHGEFDE